MKFIRDLFRKPTAAELAQVELDQAQRKLLEAQTCMDYATALVRYETARVERLRSYLSKAQAA